MITSWKYLDNREEIRQYVKSFISKNKLKSIDVGASARYWSYPECIFSADSIKISLENNIHFNLNLEDKNSWKELLNSVTNYGKFNFSICSHTLEDVFNPLDVIELLQNISEAGVIIIPSKFEEFSYIYNRNYLGHAHHKQLFDVIDDEMFIFPKYSFVEKKQESMEIRNKNKGMELKIFGDGIPFRSDEELIFNYFSELNKS
jgi:hypothetical protein